jgi:hypothetical protein
VVAVESLGTRIKMFIEVIPFLRIIFFQLNNYLFFLQTARRLEAKTNKSPTNVEVCKVLSRSVATMAWIFAFIKKTPREVVDVIIQDCIVCVYFF